MYGNVLFRGIEGMKSKQNNNLLTMEGGKKGKLKKLDFNENSISS